MQTNDSAYIEEGATNQQVYRVSENHTMNHGVINLQCRGLSSFDNHFTKSADNLEIRTRGTLDRESIASSLDNPNDPINFTCTFIFQIFPIFKSHVVHIYVIDLNDNAPTFAGGNSFSRSELENENVAGHSITVFLPTVEDNDEGRNGILTFTLTHENFPGLFVLSAPSLGRLRITSTQPVDREVWPYYTAQVNAFDGGDPPLSTSLYIRINFTDRNDNTPVFPQSSYNITIEENSGEGVEVLRVQATDADIGNNAMITYSITRMDYYFLRPQSIYNSLSLVTIEDSNEWWFTIDSSGVITTKRNVDREAYDNQPIGFFIEVSASDGVLSGHTFINVTMLDSNDNPPSVTYDPVYRQVPEDFGFFPIRIGTVHINDPDAGANGSYSVVVQNSQEIGSLFYLGSGESSFNGSGSNDLNLYLNSAVDYESPDKQYTLVVMATDQGTGQKSSSVNITIDIEDVNDNGPVFTNTSYTASIMEGESSSFVVEVQVTDRDGPNNNVNTLSLPESSEDYPYQHLFQIDSLSGDIRTVSGIDREALNSGVVTILVVAKSQEDPPRFSASTNVTVTVMDKNDNIPTFDPDTPTSASVREESPSGTLVATVTANDADISAGSPLTFSISDVATPFQIDNNGRITTRDVLNREAHPAPYFLDIRVFDGKWESFLNFAVTLEDINDNAPLFSERTYSKNLPENSPIGYSIATLGVTDDDTMSTRFSYTFVSGNHDNMFSVLESGRVIVVGHLDRETTPNYVLHVVANDGDFVSSNTATITVTVLDTNDNPPVFSQPTYSFKVTENSNINTIVGQVYANSTDHGQNSVISYSVSRNDLFTISTNGIITTLGSLDRESSPSINFTVSAVDGSSIRLTSTADVSITVLDLDDEGPHFNQQQLTIRLSENFPTQRVFYTASPSDPDEPQHSIHNFSVASSSNVAVDLNATTGEVWLTSQLDYEANEEASLTVVAEDSHGRSDTVSVTLNVTNVDDNAPSFPPGFPHQVQVKENRPSTLLYRFQASDPDGPDTITASVRDPSGAALSQFHIARVQTSNTFEFYTSVSLNRESAAYHTVRVTLTDSEGLSSHLDVEVRVLDVNDNAPVFSPARYTLSIEENEIPGSVVGTVSAVDSDEGENGDVQYELETTSELFRLDPSTGVLTTLVELDRESQDTYNIVVVARDRGSANTQSASTTVVIRVLDKNDNFPTFHPSQSYSAEIREDASPGTLIVPVYASDEDFGTNAQLTLGILEPYDDEAMFGFHGNNMVVTGSLDYETQQSYLLHVKAEDGGGLSTIRVFNITIIDVNDEAPVLVPSSESVTISENAPRGSRVAGFTASDGDSGDGGVVEFSLGMGNYRNTFEISSSGVVTLARGLDYEKQKNYSLEVVARDSGSPTLLRVAILTVNVENVNDNPPLFEIDSVSVLVSESASVGDSVIQVTATDADSPDSSGVTYSFLAVQPNDGSFTISSSSGTISLAAKVDYETTDRYTLLVEASDEGGMKSWLTVTVFVQNVNDNPPVFRPPLDPVISIPENTAPGTILTTVSAIDPDNATYTAVSLSLRGDGSEHFQIDLQKYYLQLASKVDAEDRTSINLTVRAEDKGDPPLVREEFILIKILDINDKYPVFQRASYSFDIVENSQVGASVGAVKATDEDAQSNKVTYTLRTPSELYDIVASTGEIVTLVVMDFEGLAIDERCTLLVVVATDSSFDPHSSSVNVTVCVVDGNDHRPVFDDPVYYASVNELAPVDNTVTTITATDLDQSSNQEITYSLSGSTLFDIDQTSGAITVAATLNADNGPTHEVNVTAQDGGIPSLSSTVRVVLSVTTSSDRPPSFPNTVYKFTVAENTPASEFRKTVAANDPDSGTNGQVGYQLEGRDSSSIFEISSNGVLSLSQTPDYEVAHEYSFQVVATDGAGRSTTAFVTVEVTDINDNTPAFAAVPSNVQLSTVDGSGYTVFTLSAQDEDSGENSRLSYSLQSQSSGNVYLSIDPDSGDVENTQPLTEGLSFSVTFRATDHGSASHSSSVTISFSVIDASDSAPSFGELSPYTIHVNEDAERGVVVHTFTATSQSLLDPPRTYSLSHTSFSGNLFALNASTGQLSLEGELDYETTPRYTFVIGSRQEADGQWLSDYLNVTLLVTDVNDNTPVFKPLNLTDLSFPEDRPQNSLLFRVTATDRDSGSAGEIQYSIANQSYTPALRINSLTGDVYVMSGLDAERGETFQLVVMATDKGRLPRSSTMLVNITVKDVNDNVPRFAGDEDVMIPENSPLNTIVYLSHADDRDPSTSLVYSIAWTKSYSSLTLVMAGNDVFSIDTSSGTIRLNSSLNREVVDRYKLSVRVTDGEHMDSMLVNVDVGDVNDNTPSFDDTTRVVTMNELSPAGTEVVRLRARDADTAENALITYSLAGGLLGSVFKIDQRTGVVSLASQLDPYERDGTNTISGSVVATDGGSPPRSSSISVTVNIIDVNDHPPIFDEDYSNSTTNGILFSNRPSGSEVLRILASDPDTGNNAEIEYRIHPNDITAQRMFTINSNAIIEVGGTLILGLHTFTVEAWNSNPDPYREDYILYSTAVVAIQVNMVNSHSPMFRSPTSGSISENAQLDTEVASVVATDADYGINGQIVYSISTRNVPFAISTLSGAGVVTVSGPLDRETTGSYELVIVAADKGYPVKVGSTTLSVTITDINDNSPRILFGEESKVRENVALGTLVITLSAKDDDEGVNSEVEYSVLNEVPFSIEKTSGAIRTAGVIDREQDESFEVAIVMKDRGEPPLSTNVNITISVEDVNEFQPRFIKSSYEFMVRGSFVQGDEVGVVKAEDEDSTSVLTYSFVDGEVKGYFTINSSTGQIFLIADRQEDVSPGVGTSARRRRQAEPEDFNIITGRVMVTDSPPESAGGSTSYAQVSFNVSTVFISSRGNTSTTPPPPLELWMVIALAVGAVLLAAFVCALVIAGCVCYRRRASYKVNGSTGVDHGDNYDHESDWDHDGKYLSSSARGSQILNTEKSISCGNISRNISEPENTPTKLSRRSYEMSEVGYQDKLSSRHSSHIGAPVFAGTMTSVRSTSDLGSTVGTENLDGGGVMDTSFNYPSHPISSFSKLYQTPQQDMMSPSGHLFDVEGGGECGAGDYQKDHWESSDEDSVKGLGINTAYPLKSRSSGMLLIDSEVNQWSHSKESDMFRSQTMDMAVEEMTSGPDEPVWHPAPYPQRRSQSSQGNHHHHHHHHHNHRNIAYYKQRSADPRMVGSSLSMYQGADGYYQPPQVPYQHSIHGATSYQGIHKPRKASSVISEPYYNSRGYRQGRHSSQSNHSQYYHRQASYGGRYYEHTYPYHYQPSDVYTQSTQADSLSQPSVSPADDYNLRPSYGPEPHSNSESLSSLSIASTRISGDENELPDSTTEH